MPERRGQPYIAILTPFLAATGLEISRPAIAYYSRYALLGAGLEIGLIASGLMLGRTLGSLLLERISEKLKSMEPLVMIAILASAGILTILTLATNVGMIIGLRTLQGVLAGLAWPALQGALSEKVPVGKRSFMMGFYFIGGGIGRAFGSGLYTLLDPSYSEAIFLSAFLYILALLPLFQLMKYPRVASDIEEGNENWRGPYPMVLVVLPAFAIGYMWGIMSEIFIVYIKEVYSMARTEVTELLFYGYLIGAGLGLLFGKVADRIGEHRVIAVGSAIVAVAGLSLMFRMPYLLLVFVVALLASLYRGLLPVTRGLASKAARLRRSVSLSNAASSVGAMVSPVIAGLAYGHFGGDGFIIMGGVGFALAALPALSVPALVLWMERKGGL